MRRMFVLILIFFLAGCVSQKTGISQVVIKNISVDVEISDSFSERRQGLMFREFLDENSGMLFVYEDENQRSFWMKNTFIPLDIIFLDSDKIVVDIFSMDPCTEGDCRNYLSKPAKYALEVNKGFSEENSFIIGDKAIFK